MLPILDTTTPPARRGQTMILLFTNPVRGDESFAPAATLDF
ncbi:MAG: hypothetical protein ACK45B_01845 [Limisphaerales bacterium]